MFLAARSTLAELGPMAAKSALVLALIALGAFAFKRFAAPRLAAGKKGARMRIVERLSLEPRRSLYLVDLDGREIVVGFSERGIAFHEPPRSDDAARRGGGVTEVTP